MRRHRYRVLSLFGLLVSLVALPGHAGDAPSRASALVWDMGEIYWDFGNQHIARGMTADKVAALADKAAGKLASRRDDLAALLPDLDPKSRFAGDLKHLVVRWPDRKAFREDLLRFSKGEGLGMALGSLKGQVSDPRQGWKTPFPFFRP